MATSDETPPPIVVDAHEPEAVVAALEARDVPVTRRKIHPGDYVVGDVGVERKTIRDFQSSLVSQRLFEQAARLADAYDRAFVLLEGNLADVEEMRNPDAFRGAYLSLAVDQGIPVLHAPDHAGTASLLALLWRRALRSPGARGPVRFKPRQVSAADEQQFAVQGLPTVGDVTSQRLLERFGTVRRVYAASEAELKRIPLVGAERARRITEMLDRPFEGPQRRLEL